MLGASEAASVAAVREVVEQPLSLQPLELLGQRNVRLQALPLTPEATSSATNANETLFRFAVVSDTHFWLPSTARAEWGRQSDALPERDGGQPLQASGQHGRHHLARRRHRPKR